MMKSITFLTAAVIALSASCAFAQDNEIEILFEEEDEISFDNENNDDYIELDAIHIDAKKARLIYHQETPFVQDIDASTTQSVNDWLEQAPTVYGDSSGKGQRLIIARGFTTRQLSFRFDDIPIDTGFDGITGLDVIPMNWIGSGQLKFADATPDDAVGLGGGILMHAATPARAEAAFETSLTGARFSLSHGMNKGPWSWILTAGAHASNGFPLSHHYQKNEREDGGLRDASKSYGYNALAKISRALSHWGELELMGAYANAPRDVPTGIGTGNYRYWTFPQYFVALSSAKLSFHTTPINGFLHLWYQNQSNRLEAFDNADRNTQTTSVASNSDWTDQDIGALLFLASSPLDVGLGMLDIALRNELRYQNHFSKDLQFPNRNETIKKSDRITFDIRPTANWQPIAPLFISASAYAVGDVELSHSDTSKDVKELQQLYNGGFNIGIDYIPRTDLKISARAARRLRLPTLKEQFSRASEYIHSDFNLNAEIAWNMQLQIDYTPLDILKFQITGYDSEIRDLINFRYISGIKEAYNIDSARIAGIDFAAHVGPLWHLSLDATYSYIYAYDLNTDLQLTDRPAHNVKATLSYQPLPQLKLSVRAQFESKRRTEAWMSASSAWLGSVFLLDAQIDYITDHFSAYIRGSNLTDYNYARAFGYPEPGFQLFVGAKIKIDTFSSLTK